MNSPSSLHLSPTSDSAALRQTFSCFPSGVVGVCATVDGTDLGMAASAFTPVSLEPALVSLCVQNTSKTWPQLRSADHIGVSVFASSQDQLCRQMAGPADHRFDGIRLERTGDAAIFIPGSAAQLSCELYSEIPAGDHILVLLRIESLHGDVGVDPLVFHASTFRSLEVRRG